MQSPRLRHVIETSVEAALVPGAVVLGAVHGRTVFHHAFGARQSFPAVEPATIETVYDIASLTKAVATSVLMMRVVADGLVGLDDQVARHLPEFAGAGKELVTVRHLLCHSSGLPAHRPFYDTCKQQLARNDRPASAVIGLAAATEPLVKAPGTISVYSDLGFILLGALLERVTGMKLDALFRQVIASPLRLKSTTFIRRSERDPTKPSPTASPLLAAPVAPTESCAVRGRLVVGQVHDLNAFAMGGVAGHAGLFSDARDLGTIAAALVAAWQGAPSDPIGNEAGPTPAAAAQGPLVPREVIQEFWRPAGVPGSTWRLGWDGPAAHDSQAGARISRQAVGHLGFTGCSLWIDAERALWVVLLTNRVHPTVRPDPRFRAFRAAVQDAAVDTLLDVAS